MVSERFEVTSQTLDDRTVRLRLVSDSDAASWRSVLAAWRNDPGSADCLGRALAGLSFSAFRWETPPMVASRLDAAFECVAVADPALDVAPDPTPFTEHLRDDRAVVRFPNLGGDAVMVVPCRQAEASAYAHLAAFLRAAPIEQQRALWHEVSLAMADRLGDSPVWLSTAGGGVAWLHVRLDDRPKYYAHAPYREF